MNDRLAPLYFLPPPTNTPWTGAPTQSTAVKIARRQGGDVTIELPLFWHDPPWYKVATPQADMLALSVGRMDVLITALRSDLASGGEPSQFHSGDANDDDDSDSQSPTILPRAVPYRAERFGLDVEDFDDATIIDVRLMMPRDESGRFAYSPAQIQRWEGADAGESPVEMGFVPAATFPPDVVSMDHLSSKLDQLRKLSPSAAVFASMGPYRLEEELPSILSAGPDGLILKLDELQLEGLQLAALTRRARQLMNDAGATAIPLWIVPGEVTPDDAVKLVALGASAVAIDAWCNPLIESVADVPQPSTSYDDYEELAEEELEELIERFTGLYLSLHRVSRTERLGSFSATWARTLSVRALR